MTKIIGPRRVEVSDVSGISIGKATLVFSLRPNRKEASGRSPDDFSGEVRISGAGWDQVIQVYATDEILLVGRLMKISAAFILGECRRNGWIASVLECSNVTDFDDLF